MWHDTQQSLRNEVKTPQAKELEGRALKVHCSANIVTQNPDVRDRIAEVNLFFDNESWFWFPSHFTLILSLENANVKVMRR